jgi:hypothetical protein
MVAACATRLKFAQPIIDWALHYCQLAVIVTGTKLNYAAWPDEAGHFGPYGGKFVPETLMPALDELEEVYLKAKSDKNSRPNSTTCCAPLLAAPRRSPLRDG